MAGMTAYVDFAGRYDKLFAQSRIAGATAGGNVAAGFSGALKRFAAPVAVAAAAGAAYKLGESFNTAYNQIRVGTGKTGKALQGLKNDFKAVAASSAADFGTAASAVTELNKRLGITGKPLQTLSTQMVRLSRITKTDLNQNIASVTRAFGDWEVATGDQSKTLDFFFRAAQASGATVDQLASQVVQFGAPLRQVGFSLEESTAMFAQFEKAGVNTQTMMPGLRLALGQFLKDGRKPAEALRETFKGIADGTISTTEALKIFGKRSGADMIEAIQQGRFELEDFTASLANGSDTIAQAAADTSTLASKFGLLKNKVLVGLEPLATRVYGALNDGMAKLVPIAGTAASAIGEVFSILFAGDFTGAGPFAEDSPIVSGLFTFREAVLSAGRAVRDFLAPIFEAIASVGERVWSFLGDHATTALAAIGVAIAVVAGAAVLGALITGLGFLATVVAAVGSVLLSPLGLLAALAAGLVVAYRESEPFRDVVDRIATVVRDRLVAGLNNLIWAFQSVRYALSEGTANLGGWVGTLQRAALAIVDFGGRVRTAIASIDWSGVWSGLTGSLGSIGSGIVSAVGGLVSTIVGILGRVDWGGTRDRLTRAARTAFGILREIAVPVLGAIAAMAANVAAGLVASGIASAIAAIATGLGTVGTAVAALLNPVTLIVGAIAGLGFGLTWLYQNVEPVRNAMDAVGSAVMELVRSIGSLLAPTIDLVQALFAAFWPVVQMVGRVLSALIPVGRVIATALGAVLVGAFYLVAGAARVLATVIGWVANVILPALTWVVSNVLAPVIGFLANLVGTVLVGYFRVLGQVAALVWSGISTAVTAAWGFLQPIFSAIWGWISANLVPVFQAIGSVVATVFQGVWSAISAAWGFVQPIFAAIWGWIARNLMPVFQSFQAGAALAWNGIQAVISAVWGVLQPIFAAIVIEVGTKLATVFRTLQTVVGAVWDAISGAISAAWGFVQPIFSTVADWVGTLLVAHFEALQTVAETVWSAISTAISGAWDLIHPVLETVVGFVEETLTPVWDTLSTAVSDAFDAIPGAIGDALGLAGDAVAGFLRGAAGIADGVGLDAIADGLRSAATSADGWGEGFAAGGPVTGGIWGRDSVPAMLMPGEFVQRTSAVQRWGTGAMDALNRGRVPAGWSIPGYAEGGLVGDIAGAAGDAWDATGGKVVATVADKLRDIASGALERIWPEMGVPNNLLGIVPGGINHVRSKVIELIKGKAAAAEQAQVGSFLGGVVEAGSNRALGQAMAEARGWTGSQWTALNNLWMSESGWRNTAQNPTSTAYGIAQFLDSTWGGYGIAKTSDPALQIEAGLRYIADRYGTPADAWSAWQSRSPHWYSSGGLVSVHGRSFDTGGILEPGWNLVKNMTGAKEALQPRDTAGIGPLVKIEHMEVHDRTDADAFFQGVNTYLHMTST